MRRWLVERFFAWIQWQRRSLIRWEYHAHNFLGFVQLASSLSSSNDFETGSRQKRSKHALALSVYRCQGSLGTLSRYEMALMNAVTQTH